MSEERYRQERARIEQGHVKYRDKLKEEGKLFVRDRLQLLLDPGDRTSRRTSSSPAIRSRTRPPTASSPGSARSAAAPCASWPTTTRSRPARGARRRCRRSSASRSARSGSQVPLLYLVDAAGGRISEQIKIFPGRFHAGRIFYNEVQLSGVVPQVCILFGPSPAGSAYLPALTDCVIMVDGKASLYVGSPRMVEMAIGEKTTLEELGGARMHCSVSGCGDVLRRVRRGGDRARQALPRVHAGLVLASGPPPARVRAAEARPRPSRRSCPTTSASGSTCTR